MFQDHDYAPEVLRKWKEYTEAKHFQREENKLLDAISRETAGVLRGENVCLQ